MRLVGGSTESEGRVEFCQSGIWGTVCDDAWGVNDATVVCRQLGYADISEFIVHMLKSCLKPHLKPLILFGTICINFYQTDATAYSFARFGQGSGPIYLDQVGCTGTEAMLGDCPANPIGVHDCSHFEDAGAGCQG